jgi:hypothetical protein
VFAVVDADEALRVHFLERRLIDTRRWLIPCMVLQSRSGGMSEVPDWDTFSRVGMWLVVCLYEGAQDIEALDS